MAPRTPPGWHRGWGRSAGAGNHQQASARPSEALAQHRWHWTIDESNPERVSLSEYARSVGRHLSNIAAQVKGYTL